MISSSKTIRYLMFIFLLSSSVFLNTGCVSTGDTIAIGGSTAEGGDVNFNVSPQMNINIPLSDAIKNTATKAAKGYLSGLSSSLTKKDKNIAIQKGVKAGENKAEKEGKPLNKKEKKALKKHVEKVVHDRT